MVWIWNRGPGLKSPGTGRHLDSKVRGTHAHIINKSEKTYTHTITCKPHKKRVRDEANCEAAESPYRQKLKPFSITIYMVRSQHGRGCVPGSKEHKDDRCVIGDTFRLRANWRNCITESHIFETGIPGTNCL